VPADHTYINLLASLEDLLADRSISASVVFLRKKQGHQEPARVAPVVAISLALTWTAYQPIRRWQR
jgi:hypothetical protein